MNEPVVSHSKKVRSDQRPCNHHCPLFTHHLTLAHNANSMPIKANMCIFPVVRNASVMKTIKRKVKAPSTMRRKVGFKEEPGWRMSVMKESSGKALVAGMAYHWGGLELTE